MEGLNPLIANYIYFGNRVFKKYSYEWKEPQGDVTIDQHAIIDMRAKEIILETGVSVIGGASLHAYLGYTEYCTEDMSQRNAISENVENATISNLESDSQKLDISNSQNVNIRIYQNPIGNSEK